MTNFVDLFKKMIYLSSIDYETWCDYGIDYKISKEKYINYLEKNYPKILSDTKLLDSVHLEESYRRYALDGCEVANALDFIIRDSFNHDISSFGAYLFFKLLCEIDDKDVIKEVEDSYSCRVDEEFEEFEEDCEDEDELDKWVFEDEEIMDSILSEIDLIEKELPKFK